MNSAIKFTKSPFKCNRHYADFSLNALTRTQMQTRPQTPTLNPGHTPQLRKHKPTWLQCTVVFAYLCNYVNVRTGCYLYIYLNLHVVYLYLYIYLGIYVFMYVSIYVEFVCTFFVFVAFPLYCCGCFIGNINRIHFIS